MEVIDDINKIWEYVLSDKGSAIKGLASHKPY